MNDLSSNGSRVSYETWIAAIASSACIGFTSLVPWLFNLTFFEQSKVVNRDGSQDFGDTRMKYLLSFAIGAILGDIFFHLIPESVQSLDGTGDAAHRNVGVSIIAGIFMFVIVEMILQRWSGDMTESESAGSLRLSNDEADLGRVSEDSALVKSTREAGHRLLGFTGKVALGENIAETNNNEPPYEDRNNNNELTPPIKPQQAKIPDSALTTVTTTGLSIDPAGYLNLIANGFDNFTHGLAIGASFLVGPKVGLLTTFVIIIHEIPHEICDYAILVKSGFSRWDAVKAQSSVSLFGILGTATALYVKSIDNLNAKTSWILPFSAGGFLYIALVTLLPDILDKETNFQNSITQIGCVILGIAFMGAVALF